MAKLGKYIVFEGPDGVGKTTQANELEAYFKSIGSKVLQVNEPGGMPIGNAIRAILLDKSLDREPITNLLLFTANRHELWFKIIKPALEKGINVISSRNYWSSIAYQGYGEGMDTAFIRSITAMHTEEDYMSPNYGIILDFKNEAERQRRLEARGETDLFESKPSKFQSNVKKGYAEIAKHHNIKVVDATGSIEAVHQRILNLIEDQP